MQIVKLFPGVWSTAARVATTEIFRGSHVEKLGGQEDTSTNLGKTRVNRSHARVAEGDLQQ